MCVLFANTETATDLENFAVVVGLNDGIDITTDVININLHRSNEVSTQEQIPIEMETEIVAAVYRNTMYVIGIGTSNDEIYKYTSGSGWAQCASLIQGRRRHSAAFIDEVLYICGGFVDSAELVLDSVEAFNSSTNKCTVVGKLVHGVESSGNCVPFRSSLFIFGGSDKDDNSTSHIQLYNTNDNTCTLVSKPMPRPCHLLRAVLWETTVILLGRHECFIFNIETETWLERPQFKANVGHFGLALENKRVFVIGGGICETDENGDVIWKCRDDVRYIPLQNILDDKAIEWKMHATLPQPTLIQAYAAMRCKTTVAESFEIVHVP